MTNGGRVLGVTATADRLTAAITQAYAAAEKIPFEKLHKRTDIGLAGAESNCGTIILHTPPPPPPTPPPREINPSPKTFFQPPPGEGRRVRR